MFSATHCGHSDWPPAAIVLPALLHAPCRWYASRPPGHSALSLLQQKAGGAGNASILSGNDTSAAAACLLWGVPDGSGSGSDPITYGSDYVTYMQLQCSEGYTGTLCAA